MSEATFKRCRGTIKETAAAAITAGDVSIKAGRAAIAIADYASGDPAEHYIEGVFTGVFTAVAVAANVGDGVWWDESAGALTIVPSTDTGDAFAGILTAAMAASAVSGEFDLNVDNIQIGFREMFAGRTFELKTDDHTIDAEDTGKVIGIATDAKTLTLLATVAGLDVIFVNLGADDTVAAVVDPNAGDAIVGADNTGGDGKTWTNTKVGANRWDYLHLRGDAGVGWKVQRERGVWAIEA